jgi:hypothetical protein
MKILVTGMSPSQCGRATPLQLHNVGEIFADALRHAGHDVEQRSIELGEPLDAYDRILVGMSPPLAVTANWCYPILHAIGQYGSRIVMFCDDWQIRQIPNNLNTILREPKRLLKNFFSGRPGWEWANQSEDYLVWILRALQAGNWPPFIIGTWGDVNPAPLLKIIPTRQLVAVDPTPLTRTYDHVVKAPPDERERLWVVAALDTANARRFVDDLQMMWPQRVLQARKKGDTPRDALTENELVSLYGTVWGTLAPPYYKAIMGIYWRYRYVHAARAGCITVGRDLQTHSAFQYGPRQLEQFTNEQLYAVAEAQAQTIWRISWSADQLISTINQAVVARCS